MRPDDVVSDIETLTFQREVRGSRAPGLARAALLFAREVAYPSLRISRYMARLDAWAEAARHRIDPDAPPAARGAALAGLLFDDIGLSGNREEYYDPRNSFLNEVMDRRLGIPIALSMIYLEVASRVGLTAEGIGLPGHFIVAVRDGPARHFLDPFRGGLAIPEADLPDLVRRSYGYTGALEPDWLEPLGPTGMLARMLANLRSAYLRLDAWREAGAVVQRLCELQPNFAGHVRDLAVISLECGSPRRAVLLFEQYLARSPDAPDYALVHDALNALLKRLNRQN